MSSGRSSRPVRWRDSDAAPNVLSATLAGTVGVCGSLADGYPDPKTFGGKPPLVPVFGRD